MSTIPSEEHVLLIPGDANRTGQFWHRQAIPAGEFEVQFGFGVFGKDQGVQEAAGGVANGVGISDGFAFWYVYEPYASVYPRTSEEQASWNLIGYKSNPKGFGVIFKAMDREGHLNPSISCIHNTEDGRSIAEEIPGPSAFFYQYRNQPSVSDDFRFAQTSMRRMALSLNASIQLNIHCVPAYLFFITRPMARASNEW